MRLISALAAVLCGLALIAPAAAQQAPVAPTPAQPPIQAPAGAAAPAAPQLTAADLEAWLDGFMPYALQRGDVAGGVVVVVKDGQVLLQKGYGYADVAKRTPVDAAATLFRPGSVSKLYTWTAVMQQVERGKLDLDADVNTYLDFKIPPRSDGKPVTLRDIMTHTAGFEEAVKELIVPEDGPVPALGDRLKAWTPTRVYPAGSTPAYSNYATALAGYLVERTSGLSFDDYLDRNIFQPLGMKHASFRQPLPPQLKAGMSSGYERASKKAEPYEIVPLSPAGSLAATGSDMAAFMIAHLQDGAYGGARILSPETARLMHGTERNDLQPLNGMRLGFYETPVNGHEVISHGGDTNFFHSYLHLFLDDGVGLFVSVNSGGKEGAAGAIRTALFRGFADRYFPGPAPEGRVDPAVAARHAKMIAGVYENSRRSETSLFSVLNLASPAKVTANGDGTITVDMFRDLAGVPKKWREISPFVWAEVGGKARLAAKVEDGKVARFSVDDVSPFMVFEPAPAWRSPVWLMPALAASLAALVLTVLLWPVTAVVRWRYGQDFALSGVEARAYRLVRVGAAVSVAAIGAWFGTMAAMLSDLSLLSAKLDWWIWTLHVLGSLAVFAGFGLALWNAWVVWRGRRGWFARLWSAALVAATFVLVWLAVVYRLVGLSANY